MSRITTGWLARHTPQGPGGRDGFWCAHALVRQGVAAFGDGLTREAALDDLRTGLAALFSVTGPHS
jgi:hypothetical protein